MALVDAYRICDKVLRFGGFIEIELSDAINKGIDDADFITALCYGVIDKSFEFDYYIEKLCDVLPKKSIRTILKIGFYQLKYMSTANYAAVNNTVEICKLIGKSQNAGFVNAVLKKFMDCNLKLTSSDLVLNLSVKYSYPKWIVEKYLERFGKSDTEKILAFTDSKLEHVRITAKKQEFIYLLEKSNIKYEPSILENAVYCDYKNLLKSDIAKDKYIGQNLGSMMIVDAMKIKPNDTVLDCCAGPGGKTAYIAALTDSVITACDITKHKTDRINELTKRLNIKNVETKISDGTVFNKDLGQFEKVLCDVPCSGLGIVYSKPDIKIHRQLSDIDSLTKLQYDILNTAQNYVKSGGYLMYSTCTLLKEENEALTDKFLKDNANFEKIEEKTILPYLYNTEGFYYCLMKKNP